MSSQFTTSVSSSYAAKAVGTDSLRRFEQSFRDIFRQELSSLSDQTALTDLELWDSLRHMEFIAAMEHCLGKELTLAQISGLHSIGELRRIFQENGLVPLAS